MCELLRELLRRVAKRVDPLATVQARAKSAASFAEKCLRKGYADPLRDMLDLAGARVVLRSESAIEYVSDFVSSHLRVDALESEDTRDRLKPTEFGYRSVHFAVEVPVDLVEGSPEGEEPKRPPLPFSLSPAGREHLATIGTGDRPLRAEIQLRTNLQHVWADVTHDRLYKTGLRLRRNLPPRGLAAGGHPGGCRP